VQLDSDRPKVHRDLEDTDPLVLADRRCATHTHRQLTILPFDLSTINDLQYERGLTGTERRCRLEGSHRSGSPATETTTVRNSWAKSDGERSYR
jgi:hypothetical protein